MHTAHSDTDNNKTDTAAVANATSANGVSPNGVSPNGAPASGVSPNDASGASMPQKTATGFLDAVLYAFSRIKIVLHIAFGNLREHTAKTLILGILITLGVMIIVCGNGFLESSKRGIERDFRANYSGDVFIHVPSDEGDVSLFGVIPTVTVGDLPKTPAILELPRVLDAVSSHPQVEKATTIISSMVMFQDETKDDDWIPPDNADIPGAFLYAGDYNTYWDIMGKVTVTEGSFPSNTENEILISNHIRKSYQTYYDRALNVGDTLTMTNITGMLIREATVCGFFDPANPDTTIVSVGYCDPNTARSMAELTYGNTLVNDISPSVSTIATLTEDDLFGGEDDFFSITDEETSAHFNEDELLSILGDTALRDELNKTAEGSWHFISLRLKKGANPEDVIESLNNTFKEQNLNVTATDWEHAAGPYAALSSLMVAIFTILVVVLAVVVFIVIMNTLIVSVIERTAEIGTIRAIGASRGFVRGMFFSESVMISVLSSLLGVVLALIAIAIVNALHISIEGEAARTILGSGAVSMIPTFSSVITTVGVVLIGSIVANFYPVAVALRITPLKAMNQGQ